MLSYQLEDFITSEELVRYHRLGGGVLFLSPTDKDIFGCSS
ncbi:hypothetical protein [Nostoc sp. T09]|nr:hypothetical protein [Nostoc sp. T09]